LITIWGGEIESQIESKDGKKQKKSVKKPSTFNKTPHIQMPDFAAYSFNQDCVPPKTYKALLITKAFNRPFPNIKLLNNQALQREKSVLHNFLKLGNGPFYFTAVGVPVAIDTDIIVPECNTCAVGHINKANATCYKVMFHSSGYCSLISDILASYYPLACLPRLLL
jgi:hypothetical protein